MQRRPASDPTPIPRVHRSTLGENVYEALTAVVMGHGLEPGDRINIEALARDLDVSPTPVREALARLESDGLVRKRPLVGYTVTPLLTRQEFTDMFDMRLVLEGTAARWASLRADADMRELIRAEAATAIVPSEPDADGWASHAAFTKLDARFHDLIAEATGNPLLRDGIARLHSHLHLHRLYFPFAQAGTTGEEHRDIAAMICAGAPDRAEAAMRAHLSLARERHLAAFD